MEPILEAKGLRKTYKVRARGKDAPNTVEAVRGVDITVRAGEIVGFLGPNGAGKTTTLRMLTTLLEPTAGTATVVGADLATAPVDVRRRIGYVAQMGTTDPSAVAGEELVDQARLYGIDAGVAAKRGHELLQGLDLDGLWERKCGTLSGGQRRRLDIAMGLIHEPKIVFLDEPSTGLDPQSRANLWAHIKRVRDDHDTTVFITTHYMDEADVLCDRILIIDNGEIVAEGSPDELKRRVGGDAVILTVPEAKGAAKAAKVAAATIAGRRARGSTAFRFGSPHPTAARHSPSCSQRSTRRAWTSRASRSAAPPSTTSFSPSPAGRSATATRSLERTADMNLMRDTWIVFSRAMRLSLRQPVWVVFGLLQPILYLTLFGPLLKSVAANPEFGGDQWKVFVPGLLVQLGMFGASFVGFGLIAEWRAGVIERMRVTPASRASLLLGRVLRDVLVLLVQGTVLVLVALGVRAPRAVVGARRRRGNGRTAWRMLRVA